MSDDSSVRRHDADGYHWGPKLKPFAVGLAVLLGGVGWIAMSGGVADRLVAGAVSVVALVASVAGWRLRHRLSANTDGLAVSTLGGVRRIPWSQVRRIEVVSHQRLGSTNHSLEIDVDMNAGDTNAGDDLLVFSLLDLGVDPAEAAAILAGIRTGGGSGQPI